MIFKNSLPNPLKMKLLDAINKSDDKRMKNLKVDQIECQTMKPQLFHKLRQDAINANLKIENDFQLASVTRFNPKKRYKTSRDVNYEKRMKEKYQNYEN
jgi:hypothetical protein